MADLAGNLPDNMIMEILSRVPPESLVHFRCVSKSWYALINDPKVGCFLPNHRTILLRRLVKNKETGKDESRLSFLKCPLPVPADDSVEIEVEVEDVHFPSCGEILPSLGEHFRGSIFGHSHGLVCLVSHFGTILLYNPVNKESRKLPPSILYTSSRNRDQLQCLPGAIGSGYDLKSRDFKVVRTVTYVPPENLFDDDVEPTYLPSRAEVYDLKKDEWREIKTPVPRLPRCWHDDSFQLYHHGFYYWVVRSEEGSVQTLPQTIMWFDMSQEIFGLIQLPEGHEKEEDDSYKITSSSIQGLNGSVVFIPVFCELDPNPDPKYRFNVWEMVQLGGGVVSWSKLFTVSNVPGLNRPLTFVGSDQLLLDAYKPSTGGSVLVLYNIKSQEFKNLKLESIFGGVSRTQAVVFVKTLFSVNTQY